MSSPSSPVRLVVVGSIALDTIETPVARRERQLGGSASYASMAASFLTRTGLVGIAGTDFPPACVRLFRRRDIDLAGLQLREGKTFHWSGVYEENMDNRRTVCTDLNVFADFSPDLPTHYRTSPFLFLGNISPRLQAHVLKQMIRPRFVAMDTMDLWINTAQRDLRAVIRKVQLLTVNESEARRLSGERSLVSAARVLLGMGPAYVLIKKGEHGSMLFSRDRVVLMPAFPLAAVQDPTGAGDMFAGGLMGSLAAEGRVTLSALRRAMICGSIVASFGVEAFSLDRLARLTDRQFTARLERFRSMLGD